MKSFLLKNKLFSVLALILLVMTPVALASTPEEANTSTESSFIPKPMEVITTDGIYLNLNSVRAANSLPQFARNSMLDNSSSLKCNDMVANSYYEHKNPSTQKEGYTYIADVGQKYNYASENLNKGRFYTSKEVVDSWMNSESHKASILDPRFTEIGFAVCSDPDTPEVLMIVQHKIEKYVAPAQPQQIQAAPRYDYTRGLSPSTTTKCTGGYDYVRDQPTATCTTY